MTPCWSADGVTPELLVATLTDRLAVAAAELDRLGRVEAAAAVLGLLFEVAPS